MLDYNDLLQLVMPCDNQILRSTLAQRPIYQVEEGAFLSADIEKELTRLFEKEIAFNRVTEDLKQRLTSQKDFEWEKAFKAVDHWNYGFIDRKNLTTYLRQSGAKVSSSDILAIIRRLDLDCDARLTF